MLLQCCLLLQTGIFADAREDWGEVADSGEAVHMVIVELRSSTSSTTVSLVPCASGPHTVAELLQNRAQFEDFLINSTGSTVNGVSTTHADFSVPIMFVIPKDEYDHTVREAEQLVRKLGFTYVLVFFKKIGRTASFFFATVLHCSSHTQGPCYPLPPPLPPPLPRPFAVTKAVHTTPTLKKKKTSIYVHFLGISWAFPGLFTSSNKIAKKILLKSLARAPHSLTGTLTHTHTCARALSRTHMRAHIYRDTLGISSGMLGFRRFLQPNLCVQNRSGKTPPPTAPFGLLPSLWKPCAAQS